MAEKEKAETIFFNFLELNSKKFHFFCLPLQLPLVTISPNIISDISNVKGYYINTDSEKLNVNLNPFINQQLFIVRNIIFNYCFVLQILVSFTAVYFQPNTVRLESVCFIINIILFASYYIIYYSFLFVIIFTNY